MPIWKTSTIGKLSDCVFRILHEAGIVADSKAMTLQATPIADEVLKYLHSHNEEYVLRCIKVAS